MRKAEQDKEQNQNRFSDVRVQRQTEIRTIQSEIQEAKRQEAINRKKERKKNDLLKQQIEQTYAAKNQSKRTAVKKAEDVGQKKKSMHWDQKVEQSKKNHVQKMLKEQQKIKKKEDELARMEKLESQLINRLKNTEAAQQLALQELEKAIKTSTSKPSPGSSPRVNPNPNPEATAVAPDPAPAPATTSVPGPS